MLGARALLKRAQELESSIKQQAQERVLVMDIQIEA